MISKHNSGMSTTATAAQSGHEVGPTWLLSLGALGKSDRLLATTLLLPPVSSPQASTYIRTDTMGFYEVPLVMSCKCSIWEYGHDSPLQDAVLKQPRKALLHMHNLRSHKHATGVSSTEAPQAAHQFPSLLMMSSRALLCTVVMCCQLVMAHTTDS